MRFEKLENSLWVEKYRPNSLDDYVSSDYIHEQFQRFIDNGEIPSLILTGRAGSGKTTCGKILVNSLDCDYLYINASDENNIDTVRTKIKSFVASVGFKRWKIVFLDEADHLTASSQAALRNMMEHYSKNARFILTCNYIEKIIDPIQSRCSVFEIYPPSKGEVAKRIVAILKAEGVEFELGDIAAIVNNSYPDIRRILSSAQMQVVDGRLVLATQLKLEVGYLDKVLAVLSEEGSPANQFNQIRQIIADSKVRTFDDLYRHLYDNIEKFAGEGQQASIILEIAKAMREDINCVDKEINVMAMIIEILRIKQG